MPGIEAALTAAGKTIAERAMREWLATRATRKERGSDLKDLIQSGFRDRPAARRFDNQLQGIALAVEGSLGRLIEQELRGLDEAARRTTSTSPRRRGSTASPSPSAPASAS